MFPYLFLKRCHFSSINSINYFIRTGRIRNRLKSSKNAAIMTDDVKNKLECPEIKTTELRIDDYKDRLKNDQKLVSQFWVDKYKNEASRNWCVFYIYTYFYDILNFLFL